MAYMNTDKKVEQLYNQYHSLRTKLSEVGLICQGSALKRTYHRDSKGQTTEYGPYYSWTRKIDNKTVTVALSRAQHVLLQKLLPIRENWKRYFEKCVPYLKKLCSCKLLELHLARGEKPRYYSLT